MADNITEYFNYQKQINELTNQLNGLKQSKQDIFDEVKQAIIELFQSYKMHSYDMEVESTNDGVKITYDADRYNDYRLVYPINTELFVELNKLMGVTGKLNICKNKYSKCTIELYYDFEGDGKIPW